MILLETEYGTTDVYQCTWPQYRLSKITAQENDATSVWTRCFMQACTTTTSLCGPWYYGNSPKQPPNYLIRVDQCAVERSHSQIAGFREMVDSHLYWWPQYHGGVSMKPIGSIVQLGKNCNQCNSTKSSRTPSIVWKLTNHEEYASLLSALLPGSCTLSPPTWRNSSDTSGRTHQDANSHLTGASLSKLALDSRQAHHQRLA